MVRYARLVDDEREKLGYVLPKAKTRSRTDLKDKPDEEEEVDDAAERVERSSPGSEAKLQ